MNFVNKNIDKRNQKRRNVHLPPRVTLGRCVQRFWDMIIIKHDDVYDKLETSSSTTDSVINKEIQTESQTLDKCDSCIQATNFIKDIAGYMSKNEHSLTKINMDSIRDNIFNVTQFGATMKITNSIKQDHEDLVKELNTTRQENKILVENVQELRLETQNKECKIQELSNSDQKRLDQVATIKTQISLAQERIQVLEDEKATLEQRYNEYGPMINDLRNQINNSQKRRQESQTVFEEEIKKNEEIQNAYKSELNSLKRLNTCLKADIANLKIKYKDLFCNYSKMSRTNFKFEQNSEEMMSSLKNIDSIADNIDRSVRSTTDASIMLNDRIKSLKKSLNEHDNIFDKLNKFYNVAKEALQKKDIPDEPTDCNNIQGNPLLDMTKEVKRNEEKIRELQLQNHKFQKIIKIYENQP